MKAINLSVVMTCLAFCMNQAFAQQKSGDAIAEAAGAYLTPVYALKAVKRTQCGYALLLNIDEYSLKAEQDVQENIPSAYKNDLANFMEYAKNESKTMVANNIKQLDGKIDEKTQCGLVVGMLLGNLTQYLTEWEKVKE